ncbi:MAG: hypothetical protein DRI65_16320 [Chloroflexota bacterium]|nr:MAG: hypothetical protein DRI65_16320 [Chloroflexota bacterium]
MQMVDNLCDGRDEVTRIFHSQRARKLQDLLWRPTWGFMIVSNHQGVGKGICSTVFGTLLGGREFVAVVNHKALTSGRQQYSIGKLHVVYEEPDKKPNKNITESVKLLFSESEMSSQKLYMDETSLMPNYIVPEIHSNHSMMVELTATDRRYAVIICKSKPLNEKVYTSVCDDSRDPKSDFIRALYSYYMDYDVCKEVSGARAPDMSDKSEIIIASNEFADGITDAEDLFERKNKLCISSIQSRDSLGLIISGHRDFQKLFKRQSELQIIKILLKSGVIYRFKIAKDMRQEVAYNEECYSNDPLDGLLVLKGKASVTVYAIRDIAKWKDEDESMNNSDLTIKLRAHYFPTVSGIDRVCVDKKWSTSLSDNLYGKEALAAI